MAFPLLARVADASPNAILIAQITDTHIRSKGKLLHHIINPAKYLRRCVRHINALVERPDLVMMTGDLTDRGERREYMRLRELLEPLRVPVYLIPGNHDNRAALRAEFGDHAYLPKDGTYLHYAVDNFPLRILALDTTDPSHHGGFLDEARLDWLEARLLEQPRRPTLLCMHHPPFQTGIPAIDRLGFEGRERFAAIVRAHGRIERILSGHIHRAMQLPFAGTLASTGPSTAHQLVLEHRSLQPLGLTLEPPGFALHSWSPGIGVTSTTVFIGRVQGPYRFDQRGRVKIS